MDTGMRDLEQIQEHGAEGSTRKLGTLLMAALATVGLVFAMGVLLGRGASAEAAAAPRSILDEGSSALPGTEDAETGDPEEGLPEVEPTRLTFPSALTDEPYDERPEVEAALATAAAELQHPDPIAHAPTAAPLDTVAHAPGERAPAAPPVPLDDTLPSVLPAALAAGGAGSEIARAAERDPMVAAALPPQPAGTPAEEGSDGPYTLQVVSYPNPTDAEVFATELRARGHRAFVISADVPERGMRWRVRVGPFRTMREAQRYRSDFEVQERMNTFVVRRRD